MDDFEENENELLDEELENESSNSYSLGDAYNDYRDIKEGASKAKEFTNSLRASQAERNLAKEGGKQASKEAGKRAAGQAGKQVAKQGAKAGAKAGAEVAAGAATGGTAAVAIEAADKAKQVKDKANEKIKEKTGVDVDETQKKIKRSLPFIIILSIIGIIIFLIIGVAGTNYLASVQLTDSVQTLINRREFRQNKRIISFLYKTTLQKDKTGLPNDVTIGKKYNESVGSKPISSQNSFKYDEIYDLIYNNYENISTEAKIYGENVYAEGDEKYEDPCYKRMLEYAANYEYNSLFTEDVNIEDFELDEELSSLRPNATNEEIYNEKTTQVASDKLYEILQVEAKNFNKAEWNSYNQTYKCVDKGGDERNSESCQELEIGYDSEQSDDEYASTQPRQDALITEEPIPDKDSSGKSNYQYIKMQDNDLISSYTTLIAPSTEKYKVDNNTTGVAYVTLLSKYVERWFIPYTMYEDTNDWNFIKKVMDDMAFPIQVTLYNVNTDERVIKRNYYVKVVKMTVTYDNTPSSRLSGELSIDDDTGVAKINGATIPYSDYNKEQSSTDKSGFEKVGLLSSEEYSRSEIVDAVISEGGLPGALTSFGSYIATEESGYAKFSEDYIASLVKSTVDSYEKAEKEKEENSDPTYNAPIGPTTSGTPMNSGTIAEEDQFSSSCSDIADGGELRSCREGVVSASITGEQIQNAFAATLGMKDASDSEGWNKFFWLSLATDDEFATNIGKRIKKTVYERVINENEGAYSNEDKIEKLRDLTMKRNMKSSYTPKISYIEGFYEIQKTNSTVYPINEKEQPNSERTTDITITEENGTAIGFTVETKVWKEKIVSNTNTKHYKTSNYSDEQYDEEDKIKSDDRYISRVEWIQDYGAYLHSIGNTEGNKIPVYTTYPVKTLSDQEEAYNKYGKTGRNQGYSYEDMYFAYNKIQELYEEYNNSSSAISGSINTCDTSGDDNWKWPVDLSKSGTDVIGYIFGNTSAYGGRHEGIDISNGGNLEKTTGKDGNTLTKGPDILSATNGTVHIVSWQQESDSIVSGGNVTIPNSGPKRANGNYVVITNGSYFIYYLHLSEIDPSLKVGSQVSAGQKIGRMGTTGMSTGVHLHFQVNGSTGAVDPLQFYKVEPTSGVFGEYKSGMNISFPNAFKYAGTTTNNCECLAGESLSGGSLSSGNYTWHNLPSKYQPQTAPTEGVVETRQMKATIYGLYGDTGSACSNGTGTDANGYLYCNDQTGTAYGISPKFPDAAEKGWLPRVVAVHNDGGTPVIPYGTLIYVKSNKKNVEDYGWAIVADTGGAVVNNQLDLYFNYAKDNGSNGSGSEYNLEVKWNKFLNLGGVGDITVYITDTKLDRNQYIYITKDKSSSITSSSSSSSSTNNCSNTNCGEPEGMYEMLRKAKELTGSGDGSVSYSQANHAVYSNKADIDSMRANDCSGFVGSMYKAYLGINITQASGGNERATSSIMQTAIDKIAPDGYSVTYGKLDNSFSNVQPGDILWRGSISGNKAYGEHVGIYYGEKYQIDLGGGASGSEPGPNYKIKNTYTHYIRYTSNANCIAESSASSNGVSTGNNKKYIVNNNTKVKCRVCNKEHGALTLLYAICEQECNTSYDGTLAVMSCILNRCESNAWKNYGGTDPVKQATASGQFCYTIDKHWHDRLGKIKDTTKKAVNDALNGKRNHNYLSFRADSSSARSNHPSGENIGDNWYFSKLNNK